MLQKNSKKVTAQFTRVLHQDISSYKILLSKFRNVVHACNERYAQLYIRGM